MTPDAKARLIADAGRYPVNIATNDDGTWDAFASSPRFRGPTLDNALDQLADHIRVTCTEDIEACERRIAECRTALERLAQLEADR